MKTKISLWIVCILSSINLSFISNTDPYVIDLGHTYIGFDVERFWVGEVSGRFNEFSGDVTINGDDLSSLQANITISVSSLDTNHPTRDGHLTGEIWLDAAKYPEIKFVSKEVVKDNNQYVMKGDLTIRDITKAIEFPVTLAGPYKDPTQKTTIGIKADLEIDRFDYGISFNRKLDNGELFIGNIVKLKIRALAEAKK